MNFQSLKTIPELQNKLPDEKNRLVKVAYASDRGLFYLNIMLPLVISILLPVAIYLTEWVLGYRSILRSIPLYFLLAALAQLAITRCVIYPRMARVLRSLPRINSANLEET